MQVNIEIIEEMQQLQYNPYPTTPMWEPTFRQDIEKWVDRQLELAQYIDLDQALISIMRLTKGKMNPTFVIQAWRKLQ